MFFQEYALHIFHNSIIVIVEFKFHFSLLHSFHSNALEKDLDQSCLPNYGMNSRVDRTL